MYDPVVTLIIDQYDKNGMSFNQEGITKEPCDKALLYIVICNNYYLFEN